MQSLNGVYGLKVAGHISKQENMFNKNILIFFIITCIFYNATLSNPQQSAIINNRCRRLGDNLDGMCKAEWLSYKYGIPYYYQPCNYSDQFKLHDIKKHVPASHFIKTFAHQTVVKKSSDIRDLNINTVYLVSVNSNINIDWSDIKFVDTIKPLFQPRHAQALTVTVPENKISIALHIRTGGGFDKIEAKRKYALRFPHLDYYITQMHRIIDMLPNESLHAHIFTDDIHPQNLMRLFQQEFKNIDITFSCREKGNQHNKNVMEDFFAMMDFDVLIRSGSMYSYYAWYLGKGKIMIQPTKVGTFNKQTGFWTVTETEIIERMNQDV